jgi:hypothetical protein
MIGTVPVFVRIPITKDLSNALRNNTIPKFETPIYTYSPVMPDYMQGMRSARNRQVIFGCYEAFKRFIPGDITKFADVAHIHTPVEPKRFVPFRTEAE